MKHKTLHRRLFITMIGTVNGTRSFQHLTHSGFSVTRITPLVLGFLSSVPQSVSSSSHGSSGSGSHSNFTSHLTLQFSRFFPEKWSWHSLLHSLFASQFISFLNLSSVFSTGDGVVRPTILIWSLSLGFTKRPLGR